MKKLVTWSNRDEDWKNANSLFQRLFLCRRCPRILRSLFYWQAGHPTKFYKGRLHPYPFTYLFFIEKYPFCIIIFVLANGTPFTWLVENFAPLFTSVNALSFKYEYIIIIWNIYILFQFIEIGLQVRKKCVQKCLVFALSKSIPPPHLVNENEQGLSGYQEALEKNW